MRRNFYKAAIGCLILFIALSIAAPAATERVVAIADIHGDLDAFVGILQRAQLIDPGKHWAGGRAILVQTGDLLDRGPKVRDVMDLLMSLQKEAQLIPSLSGFGTTMTMAWSLGSDLFLAHLGDSRAYLLRGGLRQLTRDHTRVQGLVDRRLIDRKSVV